MQYICTQILTRLNFCLCLALGVELSPNDNETTKIEALVLGVRRVCAFVCFTATRFARTERLLTSLEMFSSITKEVLQMHHVNDNGCRSRNEISIATTI